MWKILEGDFKKLQFQYPKSLFACSQKAKGLQKYLHTCGQVVWAAEEDLDRSI